MWRIATLDLTWNNDEGRSIKRKREGENGKTTCGDDGGFDAATTLASKDIMGQIDSTIRELAAIVRDNSNTKKEINEITTRLRDLSSQLMTEKMQDALKASRNVTAENDKSVNNKISIATQTMVEGAAGNKTNKVTEEINLAIEEGWLPPLPTGGSDVESLSPHLFITFETNLAPTGFWNQLLEYRLTRAS